MNAPFHSIKSLWFCPLEVEFVIFCPELCPSLHSLDWEKPTAVHSAWWVDLQCEKQIVSMRGCNCIAKILKEKLNQWLLLLIISLLNLICCRTVAKLIKSCQCLLLTIRFESSFVVQSCTLYTACGRRTVIDSIFSQLTLLTPDFLPQFHYELAYCRWV